MKSDSWERVTGLFEAALELAPADRRAFLEKACPGQDELQQQVKELLANHEEAEANGFLAQAPVSSLLKQRGTEKDSMGLAPGTDLGHYRLVARIGAGGMGEVYKAKDTRLRRTVAIKVLPEHLAKDPRRREPGHNGIEELEGSLRFRRGKGKTPLSSLPGGQRTASFSAPCSTWLRNN